MTDTIKISRELLERILSNDEKISGLKMGEFEDACEDMAGAMMELRALLATPPADAADMGGQAGEVVEVVAMQHPGMPDRIVLRSLYDYNRKAGGATWSAVKECTVELMDATQHRRILAQRDAAIEEWSGTAVQNGMECDRLAEELAQHRQQAGKLVEALRSCTRAKSAAEVGIIVDEALAAWEKIAPASTQHP